MDEPVKLSALALVPDEEVWPVIQALRLAHDKQVRVWPPHINILYPFVPECEFGVAAQRLATALEPLQTVRLRFCQKGNFGATAFLVPECDADPGLALFHEACLSAFPDLPLAHDFSPHLTIGQFANETECKAFLSSCPPLELELEVGCVCFLARDSMQHPFRTPLRVDIGVGGDDAVQYGSAQPYAFRATQLSGQHSESPPKEDCCNFYQADDSWVRLVVRMESEAMHAVEGEKGSSVGSRIRHSLFVVDQSCSMGAAYQQVKAAVQYMKEQTQASHHVVDFVLYHKTAKRASVEEVLSSSPDSTTSFEEAFREITDYILEHPPGTALNIVFMTDGCDTTSRDLPGAKRELTEFLKTCGRTTTFHSIGFTKSHQRQFLEEICTLGTTDGMYRYAEGGGDSLEARFAEMFDFADVNVKTKLCIGEKEVSCHGEDLGDGLVRFDLVLSRSQLPDACLINGLEPTTVACLIGGNEVVLEMEKPDPMFSIRCVDETEIATQRDLDGAQARLSGVQVHKAPKATRKEVGDAKMDAQARLDKYHQLFAQGVRSNLSNIGGNLTAELTSLRHEATFSKARRARAMAQRTTANASGVALMEQLLHALPPAPARELEFLESQQLCCTLSGDTAVDVMRDSQRDFFVFALRVCRPEDVIDAPTALDVQQVLSGVYSNEAFQSGSQHALRTAGPQQAHGGFAGSIKSPVALGDGVGLFRGPDGSAMNACLPLFLTEAHFARVRLQIKPILGYFFTLDPLGYKGDQILALFGILGKVLCSRAGTDGSDSDALLTGSWADWLVNDFTKLCKGLRPIALEYLAQGNFTGVARGDLLDDFVDSPAGRTKERLPSLAVLIGWSAAVAAAPSPHFYMAFVEELWRRNFTSLFKGQPREPIMETLERLLYGPSEGESESGTVGDSSIVRNSSAKEKEFALWARYKQGDLPKKQAEEVRRKYGAGAPQVEGLLALDMEFIARTPLTYEDAETFFDAIVTAELAKIRRSNGFSASLFEGRPFGQGFTGRQKRLMLIQALQFVGNDAMNSALAKGLYLDTFDNLADETMICGQLHERFENNRREKLAACVEKRNALLTAQRIVATTDLGAFAGRCAVSCPTRGGEAFNCLVALLVSGNKDIPLLREKVAAILTGKLEDVIVISEGSSWVHCPTETARLLQDAVGDEEFAKIELAMRGTWGHVYRESDIPNRHGHCNTHPNALLTVSFSGFHVATAGV